MKYAIILLAAMLVGCASVPEDTNMDSMPMDDPTQPDDTATTPVVEEELSGITLEEISEHDSKGDCWMAINGKVYDVSSFTSHPGGDAMLEGCGKDATVLFETRPMGSGTAHSSRARTQLEEYYIGDLI